MLEGRGVVESNPYSSAAQAARPAKETPALMKWVEAISTARLCLPLILFQRIDQDIALTSRVRGRDDALLFHQLDQRSGAVVADA